MITIMDVTKYLVGIYCDQAWRLLWEEEGNPQIIYPEIGRLENPFTEKKNKKTKTIYI